jgi:outer membrane murein-binding lipoprotein Lpp
MVKVSLVILALFLAGCPSGAGKNLVPCDANDHAAQIDLAANAVKCKAKRAECAGDADCEKSVIADCDRYVDERCHLPPR